MIPKELRSKVIIPSKKKSTHISSKDKLIFAVVANILLCLLFPVAAPLFLTGAGTLCR
jgi:oxaloacetate decarboxylase beta subunit